MNAQHIYNPSKSFSPKKAKKHMKCSECIEEISGKVYEIRHSGNIFCEDCFNEIKAICSGCNDSEKVLKTFKRFSLFDDDDIFKTVVLCQKCINKRGTCNDNSCPLILEKNFIKCEICEHAYCKLHKEEHHCTNRVNRENFKDVILRKQRGKKSETKVIKLDRYVGVELEAINGDPYRLSLSLPDSVGLAHDGSLKGRNPIEAQTPPANLSALEKLIKQTTFFVRKEGYKINKSCGVHIHFDSKDFRLDANKIVKLMNTYNAIEPIIFAMLPKSRENNEYALPLSNWIDDSKLSELANKNLSIKALEYIWYKARNNAEIMEFKQNKWDSSRYHGYNIHALFKNGNIEMRYHHGSLNTTKILNWINLNLKIHDWALNDYKQSAIKAILLAPNPMSKLKLMVRWMELDKRTRKYCIGNINKFSKIKEVKQHQSE